MEDDYQTFLKIVSWEDFHPRCNKRKFGRLCPLLDGDVLKDCIRPDKNTMLKCPVWKKFRNFYSGKIFQSIKKGELDGRYYKEKAIKKEGQIYRAEQSRIPRRQLQNF